MRRVPNWVRTSEIRTECVAEGIDSGFLAETVLDRRSASGGQPHNQVTINANYKFPWLPALSADISIVHFSNVPASVGDVTQVRAQALLAVCGRYRFKLLGAPTTLRVQLQNATDDFFWNVNYNPGFYQNQPRAYFAYLTVEI